MKKQLRSLKIFLGVLLTVLAFGYNTANAAVTANVTGPANGTTFIVGSTINLTSSLSGSPGYGTQSTTYKANGTTVTASFTAVTPGTYTIIVTIVYYTNAFHTANSSVTSTNTVIITIVPTAPTASVVAPTACGGGSTTFTASAVNPTGGVYNWYLNSSGNTPAFTSAVNVKTFTTTLYATTTYYVSYTVNGEESALTPVTATINELPFVAQPSGGFGYAYPFSGNANDVSGSGNGGTVVGATLTTDRFGNPNSAYNFSSGSTIYTTGPIPSPGPQVFTMNIWFNTTIAGGRLIGFSDGVNGANSGNYDRMLYMNTSGQIVFGIYSGGTETIASSGAALNDGTWHMATASLSSAGMKLYIDGTLVASNATYTVPQVFGDNGFWRIGQDNLTGWPGAGNTYFNGSLDDISIYNRELSSNEVYSLQGAQVSSPVCAGSPLSLTCSTLTAASYTWSGPGFSTTSSTSPTAVFINPTTAASGTYTVTATGTDGCTATSSVVATVMAAPAPVLTTSTPVVAVNANATITLSSALGSDTYTWNYGGGTLVSMTGPGTRVVKWSSMGAQTVTFTETNPTTGCSTTGSISITVGGQNVSAGNYAFSQGISLNTSATGITSTLYNFPALVYIQEDALIVKGTTASACTDDVQFPTGATAAGYDFAFTTTTSTTELFYQVESYNQNTGTLLVWVNVPALTAINTNLKFYFGSLTPNHNAAFTAATWANDYKAVYHFDEPATNTTTVVDATVNANTGTKVNTTAANGEARKAASITTLGAYTFNGTSSKITVSGGIPVTGPFTLSAWINFPVAADLGHDQKVMTNQVTSGTGYKLGVYNTNIPESESSSAVDRGTAPLAPTLGSGTTWHYLQTIFTGTTLSTFVDGNQYQLINTTTTSPQTTPYYIGVGEGGNSLWFFGNISEARVSNAAKSNDWITAEYYNQSNPRTFTIASTTITGVAANAAAIGGSLVYTWVGGSGSGATLTDAGTTANWTFTGAGTSFPATAGTSSGTLNIEPVPDGTSSIAIHSATYYPILPYPGSTYPIYSLTMDAGTQFYLNGVALNVGCHVYNNGGTISSAASSSSPTITPASTGGLNFVSSVLPIQYLYGTASSMSNLANLTVNNTASGGNVDITGGPVNLYGTLTMTSGNLQIDNVGSGVLTLKSNVSGSGSVGAVSTSCTSCKITGTASVERYITGGAGYRGYRFLSSPVNITDALTQTTQHNIDLHYLTAGMITGGPGGTTGGFTQMTTNPLIYLFDETRIVNHLAYTGGENVGVNSISGNTPTYSVVTIQPNTGRTLNSSAYVPVGNAYLVYYVGNTASGDVVASGNPHSSTVTATGYLNQGTIPVFVTNGTTAGTSQTMTYTPIATTLAASPGLHQIGNPYPSTIDLNVFYTDNTGSITPEIDELQAPNGAYVSYNASSGATSSATAGQYIVSGQGFFVHASGSGKSLQFLEHEKVSNTFTPTTPPLLLLDQRSKSTVITAAEALPTGLAGLHLKLNQDSLTSTQTGVYFSPSWNDKYDVQEDAKDMDGTSVYLSSYSTDNQRLSINQLGDYSAASRKVVKLYVSAASYGAYKLSLADIKNIDTLYNVYLRDHMLNDSVNLRTAAAPYSFSITADTSSYGANRFDLVLEREVLPLYKLLTFTGQKVSSGVQLSWLASNAGTYTGFVLEKQGANNTFSPIYTTQSNNSSNYNFTDSNPVIGNNIYRLAQNDINGNITYSSLITIGYNNVNSDGYFSVYPNPAKDIINVLVNSTTAGVINYTADIYNTSGVLVDHRVLNTYTWTEDISSYKEGVYIISLKNTNGEVLAKSKFIKTK